MTAEHIKQWEAEHEGQKLERSNPNFTYEWYINTEGKLSRYSATKPHFAQALSSI